MARGYPRQREYPHPPPPSTNNSTTIINRVVMFCTSSPFRTQQFGGQSGNVCEHTVEAQSSRKLLRRSPAGEHLPVSGDRPIAVWCKTCTARNRVWESLSICACSCWVWPP